ncbi:hypothetical protein [Neisseria meningitidis serogroup B]|uniref:Uncharacterized protein n=1 Tax=Neisseria meningitidis serogroup B TaxID=491 RepID=A0A0H5E0E6_NEIMI|nr:hypothetical protein [Neisseria meningitidis serogroup B]
MWTHCWIEPKCRPKTADRCRHSRAGGNPDLGITAIFKGYKRPVIPAQAGI